jgi:acyl-CoA thioesterase II
VRIDDVLAALRLDPAPGAPDVFVTGAGMKFPGVTWLHGGVLAAQALAAAQGTVAGDRVVLSQQVLFHKRGDPALELRFEVERVHDTRTFSTRWVRLFQDGAVRLSSTVTFHVPEAGPDHQVPAPVVPPPDALAPAETRSIELDDEEYDFPFEMRPVTDPVYDLGVHSPDMDIWYRATKPVPDRIANEGLLVYASDLNLLETAWRPLDGLSIRRLDVVLSQTLSQTVWFHDRPRMDRWLLFHATSTRAHQGRSMCVGQWFTEGGELVASVAQEGLMRMRRREGTGS